MSLSDLSQDSKAELGGYVTRIESLLEEKAETAERIKAEFSAAAGQGYDKKAIQQIIKERAADAQKSVEQREIVETYRRALAALSGTPLGDWARQWMAEDSRLKQRAKEAAEPMAEFMGRRSAKRDDDSAGKSSPLA